MQPLMSVSAPSGFQKFGQIDHASQSKGKEQQVQRTKEVSLDALAENATKTAKKPQHRPTKQGSWSCSAKIALAILRLVGIAGTVGLAGAFIYNRSSLGNYSGCEGHFTGEDKPAALQLVNGVICHTEAAGLALKDRIFAVSFRYKSGSLSLPTGLANNKEFMSDFLRVDLAALRLVGDQLKGDRRAFVDLLKVMMANSVYIPSEEDVDHLHTILEEGNKDLCLEVLSIYSDHIGNLLIAYSKLPPHLQKDEDVLLALLKQKKIRYEPNFAEELLGGCDEDLAIRLYRRAPEEFHMEYYGKFSKKVRESALLERAMIDHFLFKWDIAVQTIPSALPLLEEGAEAAWEAYIDQHFTPLFILLPQKTNQEALITLFSKCIKEYPGDLQLLIKRLEKLSRESNILLENEKIAFSVWNAFQTSPFHQKLKGRSKVLQDVIRFTNNKNLITSIYDYDSFFLRFTSAWIDERFKEKEWGRKRRPGWDGLLDYKEELERWKSHRGIKPDHCEDLSEAKIKEHLKQTPLQRTQSNLDPTCPLQFDPIFPDSGSPQAQLLLFNRVAKDDTEVEEIYKQFSNYMFTCKTIKGDFRKIVKEMHPDKAPDDQKEILQKAMHAIESAHDQFCDEPMEARDSGSTENSDESLAPNPLALQK